MLPPLIQRLLTKPLLLCTDIHTTLYRANPSNPTMSVHFGQQLRKVFPAALLQAHTSRLLSEKRNLPYLFPSTPYHIGIIIAGTWEAFKTQNATYVSFNIKISKYPAEGSLLNGIPALISPCSCRQSAIPESCPFLRKMQSGLQISCLPS